MKTILIIIIFFCFLPNVMFCQIYVNKVFNDPFYFYGNWFLNKDANFSEAQFHNKAGFQKAQFDSKSNFQKAQFDSSANFSEAQFQKTVDFSGAQFYNKANFTLAQFDSISVFVGAQFHNEVIFSRAQYHNTAFFNSAQFYNSADFSVAHFNSAANFYGSYFYNLAYFSAIQFNSDVIFIKTHFNNRVDFSGAQFDNTVDFSGAQFDNIVDFYGVMFNKDVIFDKAILPDTLNFSHIKIIAKEIDLTLSKTKSNNDVCYIDLFSSDISKIKIDYNKFRLYFNQNDSLSNDQKASIYNSVLEKFKKDGFNDSYKKLDIEFRNFNAENGDFIDKVFNMINLYWWNYGYSKAKIFLWIIIFILLFTIITYGKIYYLLDNVYPVKFINKFREDNIDKMEKYNIRYKIRCSFYYCFVLFFGLKINYDEIKSTNRWLVYIISIYIVGLICTAYLFNFVISK